MKKNFKNIILFLPVIILVFFLNLAPVLAKPDNSPGGNSGSRPENGGKQENSDRKQDSKPAEPGQGKSNQSDPGRQSGQGGTNNDNTGKKNISGQQNISNQSGNPGRGKNVAAENIRKSGGTILTADDPESTESGTTPKIKKLKKVSVTEATDSALSKRRAVQGIISGIGGSVITLIHQIHSGRIFEVLYSAATEISSKTSEASGSASLEPGLRIIAVGDLDDNGRISAKKIKIIPGLARGVFGKNPSSTASASPSATPLVISTPSASPDLQTN